MTKEQIQQEALSRATSNGSVRNLPAIYQGFVDKGISEDEILPRENVFTYQAWKALGKQVRKGEHGVKITTWLPVTKKVERTDTGETIGKEQGKFKMPRSVTVFHVSQVD